MLPSGSSRSRLYMKPRSWAGRGSEPPAARPASDHRVDILPGVAGERNLDLCSGRRVGHLLVGEGGEELALQHHEVDVLVPHQAGGVLVGEERIDGRAERGVEGLAALEVGGRVAHEDVRGHTVAPLVV